MMLMMMTIMMATTLFIDSGLGAATAHGTAFVARVEGNTMHQVLW